METQKPTFIIRRKKDQLDPEWTKHFESVDSMSAWLNDFYDFLQPGDQVRIPLSSQEAKNRIEGLLANKAAEVYQRGAETSDARDAMRINLECVNGVIIPVDVIVRLVNGNPVAYLEIAGPNEKNMDDFQPSKPTKKEMEYNAILLRERLKKGLDQNQRSFGSSVMSHVGRRRKAA